jgi:hypothetical protein
VHGFNQRSGTSEQVFEVGILTQFAHQMHILLAHRLDEAFFGLVAISGYIAYSLA